MLARDIELQIIIQKISSIKSGKIIAVLHPNQTSKSKVLINIKYKGDHVSFLPKRINDKIIFTTMITKAAFLPGQKNLCLISFNLRKK